MTRPLPTALVALCLATSARSQSAAPAWHVEPYVQRSGLHDGADPGPRMVHEHVVSIPGARWLRLYFADSDLGSASWLRLWSLEDGGEQVLDAESLAQWQGSSAFFNGETVVVQLFAAPGDQGIFADLGQVVVGEPPPIGTKAICGEDDRTPSTDDRVGRLFLGVCTAWRATNGAFVTAGHCAPEFAFSVGPDVLEFDVPSALPDGTPVAAHPDHQYVVDEASLVFENLGKGRDWGIFGVFPNPNTTLLPHQAYGLGLRASRTFPDSGKPMRITGFGRDDTPPGTTGGENADSHTNQDSPGPFKELKSESGTVWLEYQVDDTPGHSGGPVIWNEHDLAFGIHTHGICEGANDNNKGTSFFSAELTVALHAFPGPNLLYVDAVHPGGYGPFDGSVLLPFNDLADAAASTPADWTLWIVPGQYGPVTVTSALTMTAPMGSVVIGD